jgi:hypothetical protein
MESTHGQRPVDGTDGAGRTARVGRRRRRRRDYLVVLLGLAGWFGHYAYLRITLRPTPRPEYWAAQIAALAPPPPGAISTEKAAAILSDRPWETDPALNAALPGGVQWGGWGLLRGGWDESRSDVQAVTAVFVTEAFNGTRARLRAAAESGWHEDVSLLLAPALSRAMALDEIGVQLQAWTCWLAVHSRWSLEQSADVESAKEDWLVALRLLRQYRRQRVADRLWVSTAWCHRVSTEMIHAAGLLPSPIDTRLLMLDIDTVLGPVLPPNELLAGERACESAILDELYVRDGGDWLDVSQAAARTLQALPGGGGVSPSRLWNLATVLFHDYDSARRRIDSATALLNSANTLVAAEQVRHAILGVAPGVLDGLHAERRWRWSGISAGADALASEYCVRTQLDAAVTLLALGEYRRCNGCYPDLLDELKPKFLPRLPIDYADRQPLRYRRTADGIVLYSIGRNGVDDGGRSTNATNPWDPENLDAVFTGMRRAELHP